MMTIASLAVFAGALGVSIYAIAGTLLPRIDCIVAALFREPQPAFNPLAALVREERRISVRRWAAQSRPTAEVRMCAVA